MRFMFAISACRLQLTRKRSDGIKAKAATVVSADTDFGTLLALRRERESSIVLFRREHDRQPEHQAGFLLANLPALEAALLRGCIAVLEEVRIRVRYLPIGSGG